MANPGLLGSSRHPGGLDRESDRDRDGERGQGLAEYSLIIGLVAVLVIAALSFLGAVISGLFWAPISEEFGKVLDLIFGT